MEGQVNNNCNVITRYSNKYLQAQKNLWDIFTNQIETYNYLKRIYPKDLHDLHNDYQLPPESIEINKGF